MYQSKAALTSHRNKSSAFFSSSHRLFISILTVDKKLMFPRFLQPSFEKGEDLSFSTDEEMMHRVKKGHIWSELRNQEHGFIASTMWLATEVLPNCSPFQAFFQFIAAFLELMLCAPVVLFG